MATKSNDTSLKELLDDVGNGKIQLPEFQRPWVWDDKKIRKLLESLISDFPMGALMFLETGGNINFKNKLFTNVDSQYASVTPDYLVLDGQQRLTSLFQVLKSTKAVSTCLETNKEKIIERYYYLDIKKALDTNVDIYDAIVVVPESKKLTEDIGRTVVLDLSTEDKEYGQLMFPLNQSFDATHWLLGLVQYTTKTNPTKIQDVTNLFTEFTNQILNVIQHYKLPVISLTKNTTQASICQIFENVNTGGVPLSVFELVTASLAAQSFNVRDDWEKNIKPEFDKKPILSDVSPTNFITSLTLLASFDNHVKSLTAVSCKKKDVLRLTLPVYKKYRDALLKGFLAAADLLTHLGIYKSNDVPYITQYIPLAAIFAYDDMNKKHFNTLQPKEQLKQWFWCGVFGELYGGANETRYANDIVDMFNWIANASNTPDTVSRSSFQPTRLLSLKTRNSAAYKGVMALITKEVPLDFMTAQSMAIASYLSEDTDIHHIFPEDYCKKQKYPESKWNSVVNKTAIYASTNRSIGGRAPSDYLKTMENSKGLTMATIDRILQSHCIDPTFMRNDDFDNYICDRASKLLNLIEAATGKVISGRNSAETEKEFGQALK